MATFLTDRPPGTKALVDRAAVKGGNPFSPVVQVPELQLRCTGQCQREAFCKGKLTAIGRVFGDIEKNALRADASVTQCPLPFDAVLRYECETCGKGVKSFSVRFGTLASSTDQKELVEVSKLAEWSPFAPRTPSRLITLIGVDRELFLKGRRAEIEGLGIGAFSYYRRIVEQQKTRFIDEIIRVARHLDPLSPAIAILQAAREETQFSKAMDSVKDAIPKSLYIKNHNPITLLHGSLSEGIHATSDEECLLAATDVHVVLIEFAERLGEAMKEQRELEESLSRLLNKTK